MNKSLHMFKRMVLQNKFFTLILILEACLTFFFISYTLNRYAEYRDQIRYVEDRPILKTSLIRFENPVIKEVREDGWRDLVKKVDGYQGKAEIFFAEIDALGEPATLTVYDPKTAEIFFPDLSKGERPKNFTDQVGEVIAIGSKAKGAVSNSPGTRFSIDNIWTGKEGYSGFPGSLEVVAWAPYLDSQILNNGFIYSSGPMMGLASLFSPKDLYAKHYLGVDSRVKGNSTGFQLYYFDNRLLPKERDRLVKKGNETAPTISVMELVDRNEELLQERLTQDMPFNLTITIVFLSGLASLAVLNVKKLLPGFRVYRICGASRRTCLTMYFVACSILLILCVLIYAVSMLALYRFSSSGHSLSYVLRGDRVLLFTVLSLLLAGLMTLVMGRLLRKEIQ